MLSLISGWPYIEFFIFNIIKAWKNSGPELLVAYIQSKLISDDDIQGLHCIDMYWGCDVINWMKGGNKRPLSPIVKKSLDDDDVGWKDGIVDASSYRHFCGGFELNLFLDHHDHDHDHQVWDFYGRREPPFMVHVWDTYAK